MKKVLRFPLTQLFLVVLCIAVGMILFQLLNQVVGANGTLMAQTGQAIGSLVGLRLIRRIDGVRTTELGGGLGVALKETAGGLLLAAALISAVAGALALGGWYRVTAIGTDFSLWPSYVVLFLMVAIFEEVLFRGVLFPMVERWAGTWAAIAVPAVLFGVVHAANPNATILSTLGIALSGGLLFAATYLFRRRLWVPIGLHWGWNFIQGFVYGFPISGRETDVLATSSLLRSEFVGPELLTGGAFGPEASVVFTAIAVTGGVLLLYRWRAAFTGRAPSAAAH